MQRHDQCRQFVLGHILQFVDEDHERGIGRLRRNSNGFEQGHEVLIEVPIVGQSGFGLVVDPHLDVAEFDLEGSCKSGQRPKRSDRRVLGTGNATEFEQSHSKLGDDERRKRAILRCFDAHRGEPGGLGVLSDPVEQYRFSYPSQSNQQHALGGAPQTQSSQRHPGRLEDVVTSGQLRRRGARPG